MARVKDNLLDLIAGGAYWIMFTDGSRIKVRTQEDKHGEIDAYNDTLDFLLWMGQVGEPANREDIVSIEKIEP